MQASGRHEFRVNVNESFNFYDCDFYQPCFPHVFPDTKKSKNRYAFRDPEIANFSCFFYYSKLSIHRALPILANIQSACSLTSALLSLSRINTTACIICLPYNDMT